MVRAMISSHVASTAFALVLLTGCSSEDPRLPGKLYEDAVKANLEGRSMEARAIMKRLAERYPDSDAAQQAKKDLYLIDAFANRDIAERQRLVRVALKRVMDALSRYRLKRGEFPPTLRDLMPDYVDQVPETPWGHPFFYRPFVTTPIEDVPTRHGPVRQRFNTRFDGYDLACLGTDLQPGGEGTATDILIQDGKLLDAPFFPPIPEPQPVR